MRQHDTYLTQDSIACPHCGEALRSWQGRDGPNLLLVWQEGDAAPIEWPDERQWELLCGPRVVGLDPRALRLPAEFVIESGDCSCPVGVLALGRAPDGTWNATQLLDEKDVERVFAYLATPRRDIRKLQVAEGRSPDLDYEWEARSALPEGSQGAIEEIVGLMKAAVGSASLDVFSRESRALVLRHWMEDISDDLTTMRWMQGWEYECWTYVREGLPAEGSSDARHQLLGVKRLSESLGGWMVWGPGHLEPTLVPLAEWTDRYERHRSSQGD